MATISSIQRFLNREELVLLNPRPTLHHIMKRRNVRTLSLIIVTFTYLLVGAAIFDALEGPNNEKVKEGLVQLRESLKEKYKISEDDYKMIEVLIEERKPHKTGPQWKFAGSLYYAFVTLALIGKFRI